MIEHQLDDAVSPGTQLGTEKKRIQMSPLTIQKRASMAARESSGYESSFGYRASTVGEGKNHLQ